MPIITEQKKSAGKRFLALLRKGMLGDYCMAAETLAVAFFFLFGAEVLGTVAFVWWISLKLVISDDPLCGFLPFLLIGLMVLRLYDSYDLFMGIRYLLGVPAVASVLFHFLFYRKKLAKGALTWGYLAISVALALGGAFSISAADYFAGAALYYAYGSGFVMLLLYSLLLRGSAPEDRYDIGDFVARASFFTALFALFVIAVQYVGNLSMIEDGWRFMIENLSSVGNNLSTTVLLTMPMVFHLSRKGGTRGGVCFLVGVLEGLAAVLSLSRGGMIFGSAMCLFLVVHILRDDVAGRKRNGILLAAVAAICAVVGVLYRQEISELFREGVVAADGEVIALFVALALCAVAITAYATYLFRLKDGKKLWAHLMVFWAVAVAGIVLFVVRFDEIAPLLVRVDYYRGNMLVIAAKNFPKHPFFGTGIGYRGLGAIYPNKKGMFGCYHSLPVQIVGSMGLLGVAAYLFMFFARVRLLRRCENRSFAEGVFFCYLGLLWISLVNPGIFCPVVFGLHLAILFIAAEREVKKTDNSEK